jgi:IclR family transcriptional regulator, KDG regulon repressor
MKRSRKDAEIVSPSAELDSLKERVGVQSIGRAFSILEEIARNRDGITLAELSKQVGLHNSTTFHLVRTMVTLGYLRQSKDTKKYRIGRSLFLLAASSFDEIEMANSAEPILEVLSQQTGETGHVAVRTHDLVSIIAKSHAPGALQLTERAGVTRAMYCTALGKIMLAAMSDDELENYLARVQLKPMTEKTIIDAARLREEVLEARKNNFAYDDSEFNSEIRCIAVPVRGFSGDVVAAIGVSGPVWRMSLSNLQAKRETLLHAAEALSSEFGYRPQGADLKRAAAV